MIFSKTRWFVLLAFVTISSSCTYKQELDMVAVGTLELQMLDPPVTIDFSECWQGSYYTEAETPTNVLDIDCDIFQVNLRLPSAPPESGEIASIPWRILWDRENTKNLNYKDTCNSPHFLEPYLIQPHRITLSPHQGNAPYEYHIVTYSGNDYCAIYDLKIKVLSDPYGNLHETPISKRHQEGSL